jgi:aspartyl-tRNA(Asn)/glutamyl-tRNA(Gln) amidotransferase subunit A
VSTPPSDSAAQHRVHAGESAVAIAHDALAKLSTAHASLNCCVDRLADLALAHAAAIDALPIEHRRELPLAGVPVVIKDNICLGPQSPSANWLQHLSTLPARSFGRTTCASNMLRNYHSPFPATAASRLLAAGAVPIAKANMDEFGFGSSGEHSCFGPTRNPLDPSRVPGGSSSGSAAAVASGAVSLALGSDTGGSVRQPAAFCGLCAIKPTYGRVSRYGLVAYASSLDQIGPIAPTVQECALALRAIAGPCEHDATSAQRSTQDLDASLTAMTAMSREPATCARALAGKRFALPAQASSAGNHAEIAPMLARVRSVLSAMGAHVIDVDMPSLRAAVGAYYIVAPAEASSNLARFDGVRYGHRATAQNASRDEDAQQSLFDFIARNRSEGFGAEAQRRILLGTHVLSSGYYDAYYLTALRTRRLVLQEFERVFTQVSCDAVLLPTAPGPAFELGAKGEQDPLAMYMEDVYTVPVNLTGLPALQLPAGLARVHEKQLPLGVQLIGPAFADGALLTLGHAVQLALRDRS